VTRTFPVEIIWCANRRGKSGGIGWKFPRKIEKFLLEECAGASVLHPFGGRSRFGVRLDIDPIVQPDVVADAWLPPFGPNSFDVVILDPPYLRVCAEERTALFRQYVSIARRHVIWFHTMWSAVPAGCTQEKAFLVRVGDNCHTRCLQFFAVKQPKIVVAVKHFKRGPAMKYNRWLANPQGLPFGSVDGPVDKAEVA
jgi:hypothetical protein